MAERAPAGREAEIRGFLERAGWAGAELRSLPGDASFRRYHRILRDGDRAMLMDAPPTHEDVRPFAQIARILTALGLSAPRLLAAEPEAGFLLLEDLGDATFTRILGEGGDERALYRLAVDTLIALQKAWSDDAGAALPRYDDAELLREALLFVDWTLPALRGDAVADSVRQDYIDAWRQVFPAVRHVPETLVLRDYHVDNLMRLDGREGVAACGLLDFQDAVIGPMAYDLVSLLEDARRDVPADLVGEMLNRYFAAFPELNRETFMAAYAVLGAQRNAKIVGIFTRLDRRDGKPRYLAHIPRVWRLLEADLAHPALQPVRAWFDREVPPGERVAPPPARENA